MAQAAATTAERDQAQRESRGCRHCRGGGLAVVFHRDYDGRGWVEIDAMDRDGEVRPRAIAARVAAHCVCPMGRFMRRNNDDETNARIPSLQDIFDGRSRWLADDPTRPDGMPAERLAPRTNLVHLTDGEPSF